MSLRPKRMVADHGVTFFWGGSLVFNGTLSSSLDGTYIFSIFLTPLCFFGTSDASLSEFDEALFWSSAIELVGT